MATAFHVELVTPERVLFSGDAEEVSMRTDTGEIAFLANHEDFVGAADVTVVSIQTLQGQDDAVSIKAAVHGGFVRVDEHGVAVLAGVAELGTEIDVERARQALARAEEQTTPEHAATDDAERDPVVEALKTGGAFAALLASDTPEVAARRARARLEAAGATAT